jgi:mannose-1-phosphate guanylyltransferase/mannose-6-phosphate isomerase
MVTPQDSSWRDVLRLHRARRPDWIGSSDPQRHAIVLAGGQGTRLARMTHRLTGAPIPKQFCAFTHDDLTLLQHTIRRARMMTDGSVRVVVCREQVPLAVSQLAGEPRCRLLVQPCNRGTAVAVLAALVGLAVESPRARVIVLPSDHGFSDEGVLVRTVDEAFDVVEHHPTRVVLLGAEAHRPATDYGWIVAKAEGPRELCRIHGFVEKPDLATAAQLHASGEAWSTMMMVATARGLLGLFVRREPKLVRLFAHHASLPADEQGAYLEQAYAALPTVDLSADIFERDDQLWLLRLPSSAGWTDLGTEDRMRAWLRSRRRVLRPSGVRPAERDDDEGAGGEVA